MTRSLTLRLVVPLMLFSVSFIVIHYYWDIDGLFINLATEMVGIIVTVAYVDWLERRHEAGRWRGTQARIATSLKVFVNVILSGIRTNLKFDLDVMDEAEIMSGDLDRGHQEVLRVAEHVLEPAARARLQRLDQSGWKSLAGHLRSVSIETERILDRFSHRLDPQQFELLLDIKDTALAAGVFYYTFPDLAGVPPDKLPKAKTPSSENLQATGYDSTARDIRGLMRLARKLADTLQASDTGGPPASMNQRR